MALKKRLLKVSLNGGIYASYIEPLMMTLKEQLADKSSSKLIYMLNQWQTRKVA